MKSASTQHLMLSLQRPVSTPSLWLPLFLHRVPAGFPAVVSTEDDGTISLDENLIQNPLATFFVRAGGNSMIDAGIDAGDLLIVDKSLHAKQGDIVVADIGHEFTIKRLHLHGGMSLHPENHFENYPILYPQPEQEWRMVGVVTYVIKSVHSSCMR